MEIEKNIPIPSRRGYSHPEILSMEVGDSILTTSYNERNKYFNLMRRLGFAPISRKVDLGARIWRTK